MRDQDARSIVVERLKRRSDFQAAAKGARVSGRSFVLQALRRAEEGAARVGFTVSRHVGNAVERNRVRRRLRELVRVGGAGQLCAGHDYVLVGRRVALATSFNEMIKELATALGRAHAAASGARQRGTGAPREDVLHQPGPPSGRRKAPPNSGKTSGPVSAE